MSKKRFFLLPFCICFSLIALNAQSIWERTFQKTGYDLEDYSIALAADGSDDLLIAGTLWDKGTSEYKAHLIRINDVDASVIFEQTYDIGDNTWAMSIAPFQAVSGSGYAITGFAESSGIRRTYVLLVDESGSVQQSQLLEQGPTPNTNSIGLHIKATPNATGEGFVLVGMKHEDPGAFALQNADKQGFCMKLDQGLNIDWETCLDVPLPATYSRDYDVASFVVPTDQGYFITGGKNILDILGLQKQGILAVMLDHSGTELWDASYYTGNFADNGASAYYDQPSQNIYVLTNISVTHHLGISIFDANTGAFNTSDSFEAFTSDSSLDKYGFTLIKAPFNDKLLISGRGYDGGWNTGTNLGQPAFLVDYDLSTKQFGVQYTETNVSQAANSTAGENPFNNNPFRLFYYPQSLINIDGQRSAMVSYYGDSGDDLGLIVRQFKHNAVDEYEFCLDPNPFLLDTMRMVSGFTGDPIDYTTTPAVVNTPNWNISPEGTSQDTFCANIENAFLCEENIIQNGDFEQGTPTTSDEDITNAANWGGIWSNAGSGFSSADFYSDVTGVPFSLQAPQPASQGKFAGFWSRIQGGDIYREGVLNELNTTIMPNTGIYELTFKTACLFTPNTPASLSVFVANGSINGGAPLMSGTAPLNTMLFTDSWEFVVHPITPNCNNVFQSFTYFLDSSDPSFPASGVNAIFFTRTDGVQPGAYVALDDVCLRRTTDTNTEVIKAIKNAFEVYPNPANDHVILQWDEPGAFVACQLRNANGALLLEQRFSISADNSSINLEDFPKGLYIINVFTAEGQQVAKKIIVQ
jgi:hypothetical protein